MSSRTRPVVGWPGNDTRVARRRRRLRVRTIGQDVDLHRCSPPRRIPGRQLGRRCRYRATRSSRSVNATAGGAEPLRLRVRPSGTTNAHPPLVAPTKRPRCRRLRGAVTKHLAVGAPQATTARRGRRGVRARLPRFELDGDLAGPDGRLNTRYPPSINYTSGLQRRAEHGQRAVVRTRSSGAPGATWTCSPLGSACTASARAASTTP